MEKSESIKELAGALLRFQTTVGKIVKNCENPFFKSKYADLSTILETIRTPLADAGLSFVQFPKGNYELETLLMHTSGEWMSETYQMKPAKDDPQGAGSVITYQRRYALGAILGLDIDTDDDGNEASKPKAPSRAAEKPELKPEMVAWAKAVEFLKTGGNVEDVEKKYTLSKDNRDQLLYEAK